MTKYLISFPRDAMQLNEEELAKAGVDANPVIERAKAGGVYVLGGEKDESVPPVLVRAARHVLSAPFPRVPAGCDECRRLQRLIPALDRRNPSKPDPGNRERI
jgi:hypothetical protein